MEQTGQDLRVFNGALVPDPGTYKLDPVHSFIQFFAQHLMIGQVRGRFDSFGGTLIVGDDPLPSSLEIIVDTASVNSGNGKRDEDLRSPRFFNSERFPTMTYRAIRFTPEPDGRWTIDGNLTIRDITRPVSFSASFRGSVDDPWGHRRVASHGTAKTTRRDYDLLADLDRETGGLLVGKDVTITFAAEFVLQS
jgi:polyisoprenoid-binding protein YceI